jgi:hypothetical protein
MATVTYESWKGTVDVSQLEVAAGQSLKIETSPAGEDVLDELCPAGQKWTVTIHVDIKIEDAD